MYIYSLRENSLSHTFQTPATQANVHRKWQKDTVQWAWNWRETTHARWYSRRELACSRLSSDSGGRRERKRHEKVPPVLFSCLPFFNSADPTISEPGTGYRELAVRVGFSRPVKLAPNAMAIGSRGWGLGTGRRKNTFFTDNKTLVLNLYVLRQTVLCTIHGKLHLRHPFLSKTSANCMLFHKVFHCFCHVLLFVLHETLAYDQAFSTCHWFFLTDLPVHPMLDCPFWFLRKEKRSRY